MAKNKDYILENEKFLKDIETRDGVIKLPEGVLYEVLECGDGPSPAGNNIVCVYYKGWLINGRVFDDNTSQGYPDAMRLNELISGWQISLSHMRVGDKWRIYIPSALAYGSRGTNGIPKNSTLIFEIALVSIA